MLTKRHYAPEFKLQVVLESYQREAAVEEVSKRHGLAPSMIYRWRHEFKQNGPQIFASKSDLYARSQSRVQALNWSSSDLKRLIEVMTLQNDLLERSLKLLDK